MKLSAWRERQDYVEAMLGDMRTALQGRAPDTEFIEDVDHEIREDIGEHGIANITVPLLIGRFWKNPELLAKLTSGPDTPSTIFARFGILTALDDYSLQTWDTFITTHRRSKQPRVPKLENFYTPLTCSVCQAPPTAVSNEMAAAYASSGKQFLCGNCSSKAAKIHDFAREQRGVEHQLFDGWGRVKE